MTKQAILRIALPTPLRRLFDYLPPQPVDKIDSPAIVPGVRIRVPFQSRELIGILVSIEKKSDFAYEKLKRAIEVIDQQPIFPDELYKLCHWAAEYYHYSLGEVFASALPPSLRKGKAAVIKRTKKKLEPMVSEPAHSLNPAQHQAVQAINAVKNNFKVFLLDGVTGSGKTEVYLQAIEEKIQAGKQVLILVPEISLTPQTVQRFRARFEASSSEINATIYTLHSSLSEQERLRTWLAASSGEGKIIIGTRSAIFTPFANLGLIIIDEEHDTSFKQQDHFRYHARDLAIMRASMNNIAIVLGSATPSLESLLNVQRERFTLLSLPQRAGTASLPQYRLLDLKTALLNEGLSNDLIDLMREQLEKNNQVMLFLNRRGFAPVLYCTQCAWMLGCKRCDAKMVYYRSPPHLRCHHCDSRSRIPETCEQCKQACLQPVGLGTQRLEETLKMLFPEVTIIRVDRDSTRKKGELQNLLEQIHTEKKAILLGTQMLAKGHHFPNVTLVGIVDADSGLFSADFRATEQMGQLLLQVSGRAGRAEKNGLVAIQTRHPNHPLLQILIQQGYQPFAQTILKERELALLPPFSYFAVFRAEAHKEKAANDFLLQIKNKLRDSTILALGPVPALMAKRKGLYCQHLFIKANKRSALQGILKQILPQLEKERIKHSVKWVLDVDPIEA